MARAKLRLRHSTEAHETACSAPELHLTVKSTVRWEKTQVIISSSSAVFFMTGIYFEMNSVKSSTMNFQSFRFERTTSKFVSILYVGDLYRVEFCLNVALSAHRKMYTCNKNVASFFLRKYYTLSNQVGGNTLDSIMGFI